MNARRIVPARQTGHNGHAPTAPMVHRRTRRAWTGVLVATLALFLVAPAVRAESTWGVEGLGRPENPYDHAARGAGSTGIAVGDPFGMSFVNPAAIAHARSAQYHVGMAMQDRLIESADGGLDRRLNARLTMEHFVLPWPHPLCWSFGFRNLTDGTYDVKIRANRGREDEYTRTLVGTGGIGELSSGVAALFAGGRLAAGLRLGFINGKLLDVVEDTFSDTRFGGRNPTMLTTRVRNGRAVSLGAQATPLRGISLGAMWRSSSSVDLSGPDSVVSAYWSPPASFELPSELGLGLAVRRDRVRVAADWNRAAWADAKFDTKGEETSPAPVLFRNTDRLGVGVTLFPAVTEAKGTLLRRSVWRAGFSWGQLPVRQRSITANGIRALDGPTVSEWALTAGCGLPVKVDRGWIDLFLEAGRTGNLTDVRLRETFLRLGVGVTFGRFAKTF